MIHDAALHHADTPDPEIEQGRLQVVKTLMAVLSPQERKVVWYRFYCDTPTIEIARCIGISVVDVRELLSQAIFKMKQASWE